MLETMDMFIIMYLFQFNMIHFLTNQNYNLSTVQYRIITNYINTG
jgi:hypothetical protein